MFTQHVYKFERMILFITHFVKRTSIWHRLHHTHRWIHRIPGGTLRMCSWIKLIHQVTPTLHISVHTFYIYFFSLLLTHIASALSLKTEFLLYHALLLVLAKPFYVCYVWMWMLFSLQALSLLFRSGFFRQSIEQFRLHGDISNSTKGSHLSSTKP